MNWLKNRQQVADLLILLVFAGILLTPWQGLPRFFGYLLALLVLRWASAYAEVLKIQFTWLVAALMGYLLLSSFWSDPFDIPLALRFAIRAIVLLCFVVAFADCVRRGDSRDRIGRWLAVAGGLAAIGATTLYHLDAPPMNRLVGLGQVANPLTAALAFAAVALFSLDAFWHSQATKWRVLTGLAIVLCVAAMLLTGSRTGWLTLLVGCGALFCAHRLPNARRFSIVVAGWVAFVAVLAVALAANEQTRDFLLPRGDSFRPLIWQAVFEMTVENGWFAGSGILTDNDVEVTGLTFRHPHSMFVSVFFHGGVVGAALFLTVLSWTAWSLIHHLAFPEARLAIALLAGGCVAWLVSGHQLLGSPGPSWWLFWVPVATGVGLRLRGLNDPRGSGEPEPEGNRSTG